MTVTQRKYLAVFVILICVFGVAIFLLSGGLKRFQSSSLQNVFQKKAVVELKTAYKNPFDKKTQYVNPFETYKNPFVTNR